MSGKRGRPQKFNNVEELQKKIDAYFDSCFRPVLDENGSPIIDIDTGKLVKEQVKPFTMSGLAVFLDCDRQTLLNYKAKDKYFGTIKHARDRIEAYVEEQLFTPKIATGVIFNLKNNFDWKDKREINQEISGIDKFFVERDD